MISLPLKSIIPNPLSVTVLVSILQNEISFLEMEQNKDKSNLNMPKAKFLTMSEAFERSCKRISLLENKRYTTFSKEIKKHGEIWKNVVEYDLFFFLVIFVIINRNNTHTHTHTHVYRYIKRVSSQNDRLVAYLEAQASVAVKWSEMLAKCPSIASRDVPKSSRNQYTSVDSVEGAIQKLASMDTRSSVKIMEWASIISENLVVKKLKQFMKIFDSDIQKAFQKGSHFAKKFEDSSKNVRQRFASYCKAYEVHMKQITRNAGGITTAKISSSTDSVSNELFLMEIAYGSEVVKSARVRDLYLKEMTKIFDVIKVLETRRAKIVKETLTSFLQNLRLRFGSALYPVSESLLASVASIDPLLEIKSALKSMKENTSVQELPDTPTLSRNLRNSVLKSPMIAKQGVLELKDDGLVLSGWKKVHVVVTIGRFLHVFEDACVKDCLKEMKPLRSVDLEHAKITESKDDDVTLTVNQVISGLIWNSSNTHVLRVIEGNGVGSQDIFSRKNWVFAMRCQFTGGAASYE